MENKKRTLIFMHWHGGDFPMSEMTVDRPYTRANRPWYYYSVSERSTEVPVTSDEKRVAQVGDPILFWSDGEFVAECEWLPLKEDMDKMHRHER